MLSIPRSVGPRPGAGARPFGRALLASLVFSAAIAAAQPAIAGGGYVYSVRPYAGPIHRGPAVHGYGYAGHPVYYYPRGHGVRYGRPYHRPYYGRAYRHRGLSGGEAALIAAGIIGGVILIDRALEDRARFDDRRYPPRAVPPPRRGAWDDEYYYRRDDRDDGRARDGRGRDDWRADNWRADEGRAGDGWDDDWLEDDRLEQEPRVPDDELLGGAAPQQATPSRQRIRLSAGGDYPRAAYLECVAEARGAARAVGMMIATPDAPTAVETLADGSIRLTTVFSAENGRGDRWRRTMTCEVDDRGVSYLDIG